MAFPAPVIRKTAKKISKPALGSELPAMARPMMAAAPAIMQLNGRKISQNDFNATGSLRPLARDAAYQIEQIDLS